MPVFNGEKYLDDSIRSILIQTYEKIEFIIVDDGSTDHSLAIIQKYANLDNRIKIISRENKGIVKSLNEAISKSTGAWICRMDVDDISLPNRILKQLIYAKDKSLDVCGSWAKTFGSEHMTLRPDYESFHTPINLLFGCFIIHPSILMRRDIFNSFKYKEEFKYAEDFKLWTELSCANFKIGNIPEVLLLYRKNKMQISSCYQQEQAKKTKLILQNYWASYASGVRLKFDKNHLLFDLEFKNFYKFYSMLDNNLKDIFLRKIFKLYLKQSFFNISFLLKALEIARIKKSFIFYLMCAGSIFLYFLPKKIKYNLARLLANIFRRF